MEEWNLIIIGAGPAGLTAGIYAARSGLKTLILEEKQAGGSLLIIPWIENYPGFPEGISGEDLARRMIDQCLKYGVQIREFESAIELKVKNNGGKIVRTDKTEYYADAVIIASGSRHKKLGVPGEEEFRGRGVSYCALCDGAFFRGLNVLVVGGGNVAVTSAIYMSKIAAKVYLAHRRRELRAEKIYFNDLVKSGVEILWNTEVKKINGDSRVRNVTLFNNETGRESELMVDGVFICVGESPNSEVARASGIRVDGQGYIIVDASQKTNIEGVYAAGDVTICPTKQIGTAIGQAIIAATEAYKYVSKTYR
ncbi:MAG: thioredoxin-disulfide reductase [Candidatus Bathyarchaeota archaeon]|nr:thioredoxin-disulfide reductase [Candidatus Bathyarchaeota archaeon]